MSAPPSHCARFPTELWENVFLGLTPQEILPLRLLNCEFRDLIDRSPAIQYRIDLCSSEVEEGNMDALTPLDHRRKLLKSYCSRWNRFDQAEQKPFMQPPAGDMALATGFGYITYNTRSGPGTENVHLVRIPSGSNGVSQKEWVIHGISGGACDQHAIHPPSSLLAILQIVDEGRSFQIHLLHMEDVIPHREPINPIITGPRFPSDTHIVEGELQLTGCRLAAKVVLRELLVRSEHLFVWDWKTGEKCMEILGSRCLRTQFIDEYRLLTAVANWVTIPQLWDTTVPAEARNAPPIEFGLGRDYVINANLGNPFYFNLGSSYDALFHEDVSRQLVGIHVISRSHSGRCSTLLVIRYGDLMEVACQIEKKSWIEWDTWRNFIIPMDFKPGVREFGLLRSHLLVTYEGLKDSGTLLHVYDFTVRSRRQQARDKPGSNPLPPYMSQEFPLSAGGGPLSDFRFMEDSILASVGSVDGSASLWLWTV
ncbi:hypothetical protein BDM02DRAFT_2057251 [Thelephora ganbajun]|uniref:Uncharacterized protein n=1 Tax=Thelephora ganbajun TaxID=370292 RepID=A0ACB6ZH81_THEGA|nr:hypothetical protein BDM02DRAFT_2057251 [Thelephora ganbajun]